MRTRPAGNLELESLALLPATMVVHSTLSAHIELRPTVSPHNCRNSMPSSLAEGERRCELTDACTKFFDSHNQQVETATNDLVAGLFELDVKEMEKRSRETQ